MEENTIPGNLFSECSYTGVKLEPGTRLPYSLYLAPACIKAKPEERALYLLMEHNPQKISPLMAKFMDEEIIPPGVVIFTRKGLLPPTLPGGIERNMRPEELDQYGPDFSNFLVEELIPEVLKKAGMEIASSPDMHFVTGASSGGLAAWNAVWFRNDYFRRAFLSSPTFSAMRGGEEPMFLVRKTEPRPIRLYLTAGTEEPDYYFGSSLVAAENAAAALEFAGYDFRYELFRGEGHSCRCEDEPTLRRVMTFVWANWRTRPVEVLYRQIRLQKLLAENSCWQECVFPSVTPCVIQTPQGNYTFEEGTIFLEKAGTKIPAASGFGKITALGISSDKWRLYITDSTRRFVFAMSIRPDGSLDQLYKHASLHLAHDCRTIGAQDLAVLEDDRILTATELGVQGVSNFGITDLVLPLPGDLPADKVKVIGHTLYAVSGAKAFRRELKIGEGSNQIIPPPFSGYGDGFWYSRSHLTRH